MKWERQYRLGDAKLHALILLSFLGGGLHVRSLPIHGMEPEGLKRYVIPRIDN